MLPVEHWVPEPAPSQLSLAAESMLDSPATPTRYAVWPPERRPGLWPDVAGRVGDARRPARARARSRRRRCRPRCRRQRRFVTVATRLDDHRAVREAHGGTVNDVVLTVVTGALRAWLLTRAEPVTANTRIRAMVPLSVRDDDAEPTSLGSQVAGHLLTLPVGETNPVMRLHQVSYALKAHKETGKAVAASRLVSLPGFSSTTFHVLGARVADSQASLPYQLVITNVPGPQEPVYAAGARLVETYPVLPLREPRALAIGVTSYDGGVYYGINADRDAIADADVLGQCLAEALEELVETTRPGARGPRGQGGRVRPPPAAGRHAPHPRGRAHLLSRPVWPRQASARIGTMIDASTSPRTGQRAGAHLRPR